MSRAAMHRILGPGFVLLAGVALAGCGGSPGGTATAGPVPADPATAETPAAAQEGNRDRTGAGQEAFDRLVGDAEHLEGLFDLWRTKDGKLYMGVPASRLGRDFLMEYKIARGAGARLYGGTMISGGEVDIVSFEKHGDRIYLMTKPVRFRAQEDTPQEAAVALSFTPSVVESARIAATRPDSLHLVEVTNWFVGDVSGVSGRVRSLAGGNVNLDRDRSYVEDVNAFPKNLNIRTLLTYRPTNPVNMTSISDGRYISLAIHHTIAELPEEPMVPRLADDRVGYFLIVHKDFTEGDEDYFVRYVKRWRLEPGEPAGDGLVYPVKPIVYYLDRTIPEEFLPYFRAGIEAWQPAFEEAGFKDAIRAEMLPLDADADDIRYPTLRWNTSDSPGYSAIGPSVADPRTGEILDANQLYEANMILGFRRGWRNLVEPGVAVDMALGISDGDAEAGLEALLTHQNMAGILSDQGTFLRALLSVRGDIGPDEAVPDEYLGQAIRWVVMHEVGHTLGLRHNFRSSSDTPLERLHDREWVDERGLVSSVMDYHAPNVAPAGSPQGYFYSPGVGTADRWKIAAGYTPDPERAAELARLAELDGRTYGSDEDSGGAGAMDPTVNTYDLSGDPLAWGIERTAMIADLWDRLPEAVLTDNSRYADLTSAFQSLLGQYGQGLAPAVKYIGGEYVYRTRRGDPADRGPFVPVTREKQLEALNFLTERAFSETAFDLPSETLAIFGPNRWNHWGQSNTFQGRIDFPYHEQVVGLQARYLGQLLNPYRLSRIRDAELRYGSEQVLPIPELMEALSAAVWAEVWSGPARGIPSTRRDLQRNYLESMTGLVVTPPDRLPADARAVARAQLRTIDLRVARAIEEGADLDAYTRAHLQETRDWIEKALEAGLQMSP